MARPKTKLLAPLIFVLFALLCVRILPHHGHLLPTHHTLVHRASGNGPPQPAVDSSPNTNPDVYPDFPGLTSNDEEHLGPSTNISLLRRNLQVVDPNDARYRAAVCKGERLLYLMRLSIQDASLQELAAQSPWTDASQAGDYGWTLPEPTSYGLPTIGVDDEATEEYGMKEPNAQNYEFTTVKWSHEDTGAQYRMQLSPKDTADKDSWLIAMNLRSPRHGRVWNPPLTANDQRIPQLGRFSDMSFLAWKLLQQRGGMQPAPPRTFVHYYVLNADTMAVFRNIAGGGEIPWPGVDLEPESDEFKALLGSPNGAGIAWFLIQHKYYFGVWEVSNIQATFTRRRHLMLYYKISEVEATPAAPAACRCLGCVLGSFPLALLRT